MILTEVTNLLVVRHGATEFTELGRLCGGSDPVDPPLSSLGLSQVEGAAKLVAAFGDRFFADLQQPSVLLSSPVRRARDLADVISRFTGLEPQVAEPLREINVGEGFNRRMADIFGKYPRLFEDWIDGRHHWDGIESLPAMVDRLRPFLNEVWQRYRGQTVVLACHEVVTRVILGISLGWSARDILRLDVPLASTQVLQKVGQGDPSLLCASLPNSLGSAIGGVAASAGGAN